METQVWAILIQEGSRVASEFLKSRYNQTEQTTKDDLERFILDSEARLSAFTGLKQEEPKLEPKPERIEIKPSDITSTKIVVEDLKIPDKMKVGDNKATSIVSGCIPCSLGHVGTCSGLLKEAVRYSNGAEGMASPEIIDRVNLCLDELNTMERVDMSPDMIQQLPEWEKDLAHNVLAMSRATRHKLEDVEHLDADRLENLAADIYNNRKALGRAWFQTKMKHLKPEDQDEVQRRIRAKIDELAATPE